MLRSLASLVVASTCLAVGCTPLKWKLVGEEPSTALVPSDPANMKPGPQESPAPRPVARVPADVPTSMRVDLVGKKILAANPQVALQPLFETYGGPQVEVFHVGSSQLVVTEGLVKKCSSEAQLAAVLCRELGRMVSEREALASIDTRDPDRGPPPDVSFGNAGQIDAADQVRYAEMAKLSPRKRQFKKPIPPPDPRALAHLYLKNAGYREADLEEAATLLQEANNTFQAEKLMKAAAPPATWSPAR